MNADALDATSYMTKTNIKQLMVVLGFITAMFASAGWKYYTDKIAIADKKFKHTVCTWDYSSIPIKECTKTNFYDVINEDCVLYYKKDLEIIFCGQFQVENKI